VATEETTFGLTGTEGDEEERKKETDATRPGSLPSPPNRSGPSRARAIESEAAPIATSALVEEAGRERELPG